LIARDHIFGAMSDAGFRIDRPRRAPPSNEAI
jgi:hypothetical protein